MRTRFPEDNKRAQFKAAYRKNAQIRALSDVLTARSNLQQKLGQSYSGDRKLYEALGYPLTMSFARYQGRYERQDIAKRIVDIYPGATWRDKPALVQDLENKEDTEWDKRIKEVFDNTRLWHYIARTDKMAGIGNYAVLFLGFDDNKSFDTPVQGAKELIYCTPYNQNNAEITKWEENESNPRYGLPTEYKLRRTSDETLSTHHKGTANKSSFLVHWTRIVHVPSDDLKESDVYGTPRLECVYNRLQDLELVSGGSAEMFWRGAFPGYGFIVDSESELPDEDDMEDEISDYIHDISRYMRLQGMDVKEFKPQITDPRATVDAIVDLISGAKGIPKRLLLGSERGELASTQDKENFNARVDERRQDFAEPVILRPLVDHLMKVGVLPEVSSYEVVWTDIEALSEKDQAEIGRIRSEALQSYLRYPGADFVVPPKNFLMDMLGYEEEQAEAMLKEAVVMMEEEEREAREAEENMDDEETPTNGENE